MTDETVWVTGPLDTLSRLKGIEIETVSGRVVNRSVITLSQLSRLKGIETLFSCHNRVVLAFFGSAFPFEGN